MTLEICCFTIHSCLIAAANGADRIELCANPAEGGTTPSYGMISTVRKLVDVQVFPIIRSRGGDFFYQEPDFEAMRSDILYCKHLGCEGVVVGMLQKDGKVNKDKLAEFVELAYPLEVTFHRAFDRVADPFEALESIIDAGCQRILTSGLMPEAALAKPLLAELIKKAQDRIIIMPGSGIRSGNIEEMVIQTGAAEFHSSARRVIQSEMSYINTNMQEDLSLAECDGKEIAEMRRILDK